MSAEKLPLAEAVVTRIVKLICRSLCTSVNSLLLAGHLGHDKLFGSLLLLSFILDGEDFFTLGSSCTCKGSFWISVSLF